MPNNINSYTSYQKGLQKVTGSFPIWDIAQAVNCNTKTVSIIQTLNQEQIASSLNEDTNTTFLVASANSKTGDIFFLDLNTQDSNGTPVTTEILVNSIGSKITVGPKNLQYTAIPNLTELPVDVVQNPIIVSRLPILNCYVYVVGGGGGGAGSNLKQGAGGGGYSTGLFSLNAANYNIVIGAGGKAAILSTDIGSNGTDSSFAYSLYGYAGKGGNVLGTKNGGQGNTRNGSNGTYQLAGSSGSGDNYGNGGNGGGIASSPSDGQSGYVKIIYKGDKAATGGTYSFDGFNSIHLFDKVGTYQFTVN